MKTRSAKAKGRRLQQWIVARIQDIFEGKDVVRSAIMGESGQDVQVYPMWRKVWPWAIEAKNVEKLNVWSALAQAEANAEPDQKPIVVFKRNRSKTYVILRWEDFEDAERARVLRLRGSWPVDTGRPSEH